MVLPEVSSFAAIADKTQITAKRKKKRFADYAEQSLLLATRNKKRLSNFASHKLLIREAEGFAHGVVGVGNEKMPLLKDTVHLKKIKPFQLAEILAGKLDFMVSEGALFYASKGNSYFQPLFLDSCSDVNSFKVLTYNKISQELMPLLSMRLISEAYEVIRVNRKFAKLVEVANPVRYVCLQNGVFDTLTGEFSDLNLEDGIFMVRLNANFIEDAFIREELQDFFENFCNGAENVNAYLGVFGYLLSNNFELQKAVFLIGAPRNGKSTMLKFLEEVFPAEYLTALSSRDLGNDFAPANLQKARLSLSKDEPAIPWSSKAVQVFKMITGADRFLVQAKRIQHQQLNPHCHLLFAGNSKPVFTLKAGEPAEIKKQQDAVLRRLIYLETGATVPEEKVDTGLQCKMIGAKDALVSIMLKNFSSLLHGELSWPKPPEDLFATEGAAQNSVLFEFVTRKLDKTDSSEDVIRVSKLCKEFNDFAGFSDAEVLKTNAFSRKLANVVGENRIRKNSALNVSCLFGYRYKEGELNEKIVDD